MDSSSALLGSRATGEFLNQQINQFDAGLRSIQGADAIISMIQSQRSVHQLIAGHNELGDEGCRRLFSFLRSDKAKKYEIQVICLNANRIGDEGLLAISQYLKGNRYVRELLLQNNDLHGTSHVTAAFVDAINSSHLEILSVNTNKHLSDEFLANFLPSLNTPHLRELQLSATGLTSTAGKIIGAYLSSPRCRLHVLKCSGNSLGFRGIKPIVGAIQGHNYTLGSIEFFPNQLQGGDADSASSTSSETEDQMVGLTRNDIRSWKSCEALVRKILFRNTHLRREGQRQRELVDTNCAPPLIIPRTPYTHSPRSSQSNLEEFLLPFRFKLLPLELQHHVLSFLALSLSSLQRIRVIDYATSARTLPHLLPSLPTLSRSVQFRFGSGVAYIPGSSNIWPAKLTRNPFSACVIDRCLGSSNHIPRKREQERLKFLELVECDSYELDPGEGSRSIREIFTLSLN